MLKHKLKGCDGGKIWKVILIIWMIFATLYVLYGEYSRLSNYVAARAYSAGLSEAVSQIITESEKCQPVPINVGERSATLINIACLQQATEEE